MVVPLDTTAVDLFSSTLGAARSEMIEPIPADLSGTFLITAYNPRWYIFPDSENRFAIFGLGTLATDGRYTVLLATRRRTSRNG